MPWQDAYKEYGIMHRDCMTTGLNLLGLHLGLAK